MPIYFSTGFNATPAEIIHSQLIEFILPKLFEIGLKVRLMVCDMGTSNQKLFSKILQINSEKPFFLFEDKFKIFVSYDYCHLIKSVRNNLENYNIEFNNNKIAKWEHLLSFYNIDKLNNPRLCHKLTNNHLYLDNFSKQSVKLATQLFSRSVSSSLYFCISQNLMSQNSVFTAEFIENFDTVFDCLNSTQTENPLKPYKIQLQKDNLPFNYLQQSRKFISSLKFIDKKTNRPVRDPPFKNGMLISINSLLNLCKTLSDNIPSLKTRNLNQDIAEHSFSIMREKSGCSNSLTYRQFKSAFKVLMVHDMYSSSENSNCSFDSNCVLTYISNSSTKEKLQKQYINPSIIDNKQDSEVPLNEISNFDNSLIQNTHTYISGYIVSHLSGKYSCDQCSSNLIQNDNSFRNDTIFLDYKSYNEIHKTHIIPTEKAAKCISRMISVIRIQLKKTKHTIGIKKKLNERVLNEINFDWIPECHRNVFSQYIFNLLFSILIHFHVRVQNRLFRTSIKSKRKKIEKFSH
jgi:hypothetical protein